MALRPTSQARWCCGVLASSLSLSPAVVHAAPETEANTVREPKAGAGEAPEAGAGEAPEAGAGEPEAGAGEAPEVGAGEPETGATQTPAGAATPPGSGTQDEAAQSGTEDADAGVEGTENVGDPPSTSSETSGGLEPKLEVPAEPRIAGRPRTGKGMLIAGGTVLGAGLAMTITFGAITRGCSLDGPLECKYKTQDTVLIPLGVTVMVAGAMVLAVGAGYFVQYRRWQRAVAARGRGIVVPSLAADAAGLTYVARF